MSFDLEVCVLAQDGEVIVQIVEDRAVLTVRQVGREKLAAVNLSPVQAQAIAEVLMPTGESV